MPDLFFNISACVYQAWTWFLFLMKHSLPFRNFPSWNNFNCLKIFPYVVLQPISIWSLALRSIRESLIPLLHDSSPTTKLNTAINSPPHGFFPCFLFFSATHSLRPSVYFSFKIPNKLCWKQQITLLHYYRSYQVHEGISFKLDTNLSWKRIIIVFPREIKFDELLCWNWAM